MNKYTKNNSNNVNNNEITDPKLKLKLINYVYEKMDLSKYKYKILKFDNELEDLKTEKHYVSPNYAGMNALLVFAKIGSGFFSFMIDRKTLSYNPAKVEIEKVKIHKFRVRVRQDVFNGTLLDGIYITNYKTKHHHFLATDIYFLAGDDVREDKLNNKLIQAKVFLDNIKEDSSFDNITFLTNELFELHDIKDMINKKIPAMKLSELVRGIAFYPEYSGTKLIYFFEKNDTLLKDIVLDEIVTTKEDIDDPIEVKELEQTTDVEKLKDSLSESKSYKYEYPVGFSCERTFMMKKTDTPDVYDLYLVKLVNGKGKLKKYDNAYIPTTNVHKLCVELFKDETATLVVCKLDIDKNKWIPTQNKPEKPRPDLYNKVVKFLNKYKVYNE